VSADAARSVPIEEPRAVSLSRGVKWRVFFRSFLLQASWNPQGMQNLGLAYALFPALEELYPDPQRRAIALRRHLTFFNTHPYLAAAMLGGVLYHEQRIALGLEGPEPVTNFKAALMGPLAALGDGFFWLSLKPATGALCAGLVPVLHAWAAILFIGLYNAVHLPLRVRFYRLGLRLGDKVVDALAQQQLPRRGARLRALGASSAGALAAWLAIVFGRNETGSWAPALAAGCLVVGALSYWLVARRATYYALLYLAALLAAATGAFL